MKQFNTYFILLLFIVAASIAQTNPEWINYTTGKYIRAIEVENNIIWGGTQGGLVSIDETTGETIFYNKANSGLPDNQINSIVIDNLGNKWIGTYQGGLAKFDGSSWTVYNSQNSGLPNSEITSIAVDNLGNMWIGTYQGDLAKFDGSNWTVYNSQNSGLPNSEITSIVIDNLGNKWIGTVQGGLVKFDGSNWTVYNTANSGLSDNRIIDIAIDNNNNKWIGTYQGGLVKFDGSNWTNYNLWNSRLPNNFVRDIAIDEVGNKWISTNGGGVIVYKEGGIINVQDELPEVINTLKIYPNPTNNQLHLVTSDKAQHLTVWNMQGQLIKEENLQTKTKEITVDVTDLSRGIYIIKLKGNKGTAVGKFIKK